MALAQVFKKKKEPMAVGRDSSGIALFMVMGSISVLTILVSEFTYITQVSQMIAFGGLDQAQAHYLAKSGLKLSLLRLKAYQQVNAVMNNKSIPGGIPGISKSLVQKIWSFPFFYPIPTSIPGMTTMEKDAIQKFQKESKMEGRFSAVIESESSKFNLNSILMDYANVNVIPNTSASPNPQSSPQPFNPETARGSLEKYLEAIWFQKVERDPDFADIYRDLRIPELVDGIAGWADRTYERRTPTGHDSIVRKKEPFYALSELHMVPKMDDELYQLFAPTLTASTTQGININTMQANVLRALIPQISKEEVTDFFKFRDSEEADNLFKTTDDFFKYLTRGVAAFKNNSQVLDQLKQDLSKRNIQLLVDEGMFKITVQAQVNTATRTLEAWVQMGAPTAQTFQTIQSTTGAGTPQQPQNAPSQNLSNLKITFMRIL